MQAPDGGCAPVWGWVNVICKCNKKICSHNVKSMSESGIVFISGKYPHGRKDMKAITIKTATATVTPEGVKITGADIATAHANVVKWANGEAKRSTYSDERVAIVAGLIAIARTGSGSILVNVADVCEPVTDGKWNDGAALARWLRSAGCAGCAGVAPLSVRQTRTGKGSPIFAVTVA